MIFKERAYACTGCGQTYQAFQWDTDPIPPCLRCDAPVVESGTVKIRTAGVVDDTVIGGRWCETIGQEPFYYESLSQLRREADRRGYEPCVRHDEAYHERHRKQHDEMLRDTKQIRA